MLKRISWKSLEGLWGFKGFYQEGSKVRNRQFRVKCKPEISIWNFDKSDRSKITKNSRILIEIGEIDWKSNCEFEVEYLELEVICSLKNCCLGTN